MLWIAIMGEILRSVVDCHYGVGNVGKLKHCTRCNNELPTQAFYAKGSRLDSVCKECKKARARTDYHAKKDKPHEQSEMGASGFEPETPSL